MCRLIFAFKNSFFFFQFSVFLGIIFFAELIAGILGFVYKDWFRDQFSIFVNETIKEYRTDADLQNIIDFSQEYVSAFCFEYCTNCMLLQFCFLFFIFTFHCTVIRRGVVKSAFVEGRKFKTIQIVKTISSVQYTFTLSAIEKLMNILLNSRMCWIYSRYFWYEAMKLNFYLVLFFDILIMFKCLVSMLWRRYWAWWLGK